LFLVTCRIIDQASASRHVPDMSDMQTLVENHVAVLNEPDAERRRQLIRALSQEDAHHLARSLEAIGLDFLLLGGDGRTRAGDRFIEV
jgi:hypothetical protein